MVPIVCLLSDYLSNSLIVDLDRRFGQCLLYWLGIGLVSVLVLRFCALKLIFKLMSGTVFDVLLTVRPLANVYKTTVMRIGNTRHHT